MNAEGAAVDGLITEENTPYRYAFVFAANQKIDNNYYGLTKNCPLPLELIGPVRRGWAPLEGIHEEAIALSTLEPEYRAQVHRELGQYGHQ